MILEDFIEAAKEYQDLGWAVQGQLDSLVDSYQTIAAGDLNENAVNIIAKFGDTLYTRYNIETSGLHAAIDEYETLVEEYGFD